jgi:hypothetical protein
MALCLLILAPSCSEDTPGSHTHNAADITNGIRKGYEKYDPETDSPKVMKLLQEMEKK